MPKDLREMIEAASQEPVPYEGLRVLAEATPPRECVRQEPPTTEENPSHKEDFSSLLGAAVQTPKQGG